MVQGYKSIVRRIESARERTRVISINPSRELYKPIVRLIKKQYLPDYRKILYPDTQLSVTYSVKDTAFEIKLINHNRLSQEKMNEKIIQHLKEVEVICRIKGNEYKVVVDRSEGQRILRILSKEYDLSTGEKLVLSNFY
jgi:hypothetical protein